MINDIFDLTVKLGGVILKKAEFENDYEKIYSKIFEKIAEMEASENMEFDFLEVLGEMGG